MIRVRVSEIAGWLGVPPPRRADAVIRGVSIDTRRLKPDYGGGSPLGTT